LTKKLAFSPVLPLLFPLLLLCPQPWRPQHQPLHQQLHNKPPTRPSTSHPHIRSSHYELLPLHHKLSSSSQYHHQLMESPPTPPPPVDSKTSWPLFPQKIIYFSLFLLLLPPTTNSTPACKQEFVLHARDKLKYCLFFKMLFAWKYIKIVSFLFFKKLFLISKRSKYIYIYIYIYI